MAPKCNESPGGGRLGGKLLWQRQHRQDSATLNRQAAAKRRCPGAAAVHQARVRAGLARWRATQLVGAAPAA